MNLTNVEYFEQWLDSIKAQIEKNLTRDGCLAPVAFVVCTRHPETGEPLETPCIAVIPGPPNLNDVTKVLFSDAIREVCVKTRAVGAVNVAEAWMISDKTHGEAHDIVREGRISEQPDRIECVMVNAEHATWGTHTRVTLGYMEREGNNVRVARWENAGGGEGYGNPSGRFTGMLNYTIEGSS